jgi:hypothetical protein
MILQYLQIEVGPGQPKFQLFSFKKREEELKRMAEEDQRKQKLRFQEIVKRVRG